MNDSIARSFECGFHIHVNRKQLIDNVNQFECVFGDVAVFSDHGHNDFTHVAHAANSAAKLCDRRAGKAWAWANELSNILAGKYSDDAFKGFSFADINALDQRMSMRAVQHCGVCHILHNHIIHITRFTGQKARVFDALHPFANPRCIRAWFFALAAFRDDIVDKVRGDHYAVSN